METEEGKKRFDVGSTLVSVVTGRPHDIEVGGVGLRFYPVTLGKVLILGPWLDALGVGRELRGVDAYSACLRMADEQRDLVCEVLAIHTSANSYEALFDMAGRGRRCELLRGVRSEHLAALLVQALAWDKTDSLLDGLGIRKEQERLEEVMKVKRSHSKGSLSFGGVSLFGGFIGPLKAMGYTDDEILYERGYTYLRLMLADRVSSVLLSEEELNELPTSAGGRLLDGESDAGMDALSALIKAGGTGIVRKEGGNDEQ